MSTRSENTRVAALGGVGTGCTGFALGLGSISVAGSVMFRGLLVSEEHFQCGKAHL